MPSPSESSLENGLNVLKQGNFQRAIAILEAVATQEGNSNTGLQAQVGLVVAYARSGNIPQAISLCRTLTQSPNSQVNDWANRTLEQLAPGEVGKQESRGAGEQRRTNIPEPSPLSPPVRDKVKSLPNYWRRAGRAKSWQPLPKLNLVPFGLLIAGSFIALLWVIRELVVFMMRFVNDILLRLPYVEPIQLLYANPTLFLLLILLILMGSSPWLLDRLFVHFYGQRELRTEILNSYSSEAVRVLQRYCQHRGWQLPKLSILPMAAPIALTYGNLPRTARIAVSQGLLEQLEEDEIAVVYAHQLGHIKHWDFVVISLVLLITIPVYRVYQQFAKWGNAMQARIWRLILAAMASLAYGVWCLLTGTSLCLSHLRQYYCDRLAVDITGNPNGLVRALLKIAIGIASDIQKQEHINWQIESLIITAPVSYQQSICLGSIVPHTTFESFLMWDYLNPYRWWFVINQTHPMMGDRVQRLTSVARSWRLELELEMESQQPLRVRRQTFLFQIAPLLGILLGVAFGVLVWVFWQLAYAMKFLNLKWIYDDWSFLIGCLLIGFSIAILLRMNLFFPDLKSATLQTNQRLPELLANPIALPVDSTGVCLVGKLLGRRNTNNFLGRDFILQSNMGLVKLHYIPLLGEQTNPQDLLGRQITITGWLRRGATPWVDIHTLQTQSSKTIHSPHPIWSTVLAVAAEAWGAYLLLRG